MTVLDNFCGPVSQWNEQERTFAFCLGVVMSHRAASGRAALIGAPIIAAAAVCLVLLALSWPTLVARPRSVPVAITGQP
jgi:hypothetical protein